MKAERATPVNADTPWDLQMHLAESQIEIA
jgi:hypothetical protein